MKEDKGIALHFGIESSPPLLLILKVNTKQNESSLDWIP